MKIETKFSNGDKVWYGTAGEVYTRRPCDECGATGRLKIEGKAFTVACFSCNGRGDFGSSTLGPHAKPLTIGQVRVSIADSPGDGHSSMFSNYGPVNKREESYMCVETGIESGSVYYDYQLFVTEPEALAYAAIVVHDSKIRLAEEAARREKDRLRNAEQFEEVTEASEAGVKSE